MPGIVLTEVSKYSVCHLKVDMAGASLADDGLPDPRSEGDMALVGCVQFAFCCCYAGAGLAVATKDLIVMGRAQCTIDLPSSDDTLTTVVRVPRLCWRVRGSEGIEADVVVDKPYVVMLVNV